VSWAVARLTFFEVKEKHRACRAGLEVALQLYVLWIPNATGRGAACAAEVQKIKQSPLNHAQPVAYNQKSICLAVSIV